jgi:D-alanyl-D-alanine dipeptidase
MLVGEVPKFNQTRQVASLACCLDTEATRRQLHGQCGEEAFRQSHAATSRLCSRYFLFCLLSAEVATRVQTFCSQAELKLLHLHLPSLYAPQQQQQQSPTASPNTKKPLFASPTHSQNTALRIYKMADQAGSTAQQVDETSASSTAIADKGKGKGKAPAPEKMDVSMGEEEDSSEEESGAEEPVSISPY